MLSHPNRSAEEGHTSASPCHSLGYFLHQEPSLVCQKIACVTDDLFLLPAATVPTTAEAVVRAAEASAYFITACTSSKQSTGTWMEKTE